MKRHPHLAAAVTSTSVLVLVFATTIPALAQAAPGNSSPNGGTGDCFLGICDPGAWLSDEVNRIVAGFLSGLISGVGCAFTLLPDDIDFVLRTPEKLVSERHDSAFADATRALANGVLAVVVMVAGSNVIFSPYLGSQEAKPPRVCSSVRRGDQSRVAQEATGVWLE